MDGIVLISNFVPVTSLSSVKKKYACYKNTAIQFKGKDHKKAGKIMTLSINCDIEFLRGKLKKYRCIAGCIARANQTHSNLILIEY